jgi:Protein of unknown function (DUF1587)
LGIDFPMETALPPDDVGYGFNNIGDVLSISPPGRSQWMKVTLTVTAKASAGAVMRAKSRSLACQNGAARSKGPCFNKYYSLS